MCNLLGGGGGLDVLGVLGCEMPLKSILDAVRFILAEYGLVAMHGGPVHAYFVGVWFSGNVKFDVGKYIMSHTLDTAHLSMFCEYTGQDFINAVHKLSPVVAHWHMSDAQGTNGEGVQMGTGDIDFCKVLKSVPNEQSFIVETWQGHKNDGMGFYRDLTYLIEGVQLIA